MVEGKIRFITPCCINKPLLHCHLYYHMLSNEAIQLHISQILIFTLLPKLLQGIRARIVWPRLLRDFRWRTDAATRIQRHVRGHLTRVRQGKKQSAGYRLLWRKPLFDNLRDQAAHIIQRYYRCVNQSVILQVLNQRVIANSQIVGFLILRETTYSRLAANDVPDSHIQRPESPEAL